jgi:leucyl aminopeptidase
MSIIAVLLLLVSVVYSKDGLRWIQFNETYGQWMNNAEIDYLAANSPDVHFMDLTDFPVPNINLKRDVFIPVGPKHQDVVNPLLGYLSVDNIWTQIEYLSTEFSTRYYTSSSGKAASDYLARQYASFKVKPIVEVEQYVHSWLQPSIIGRITGSKAPHEIVIIGGHIDSTSSGSTAPGADDDASGSSTVLEIFRVLATDPKFVPERTLEFHGYAAEEVGLRGSQEIADGYAAEKKVVVGMLQLDMTGYVRAGTTASVGVVTDYTNQDLSNFVRALVPEYTSLPFVNTACGYGCSDHASWYREGYPAAFTFESAFSNSNPYIHTPNDQRSRMSIEHINQFSRLGLSFMVELSFIE